MATTYSSSGLSVPTSMVIPSSILSSSFVSCSLSITSLNVFRIALCSMPLMISPSFPSSTVSNSSFPIVEAVRNAKSLILGLDFTPCLTERLNACANKVS